ncbi:MAG: hypothetical protein EA379_11900, partial [Phycisphaerales bacterium]
MRDTHDTPEHTLHREDALALDALIGAGLDPSGVDAALRPRAERLAALLALLEPDAEISPGARALMADVTMARVMRAAATARSKSAE